MRHVVRPALAILVLAGCSSSGHRASPSAPTSLPPLTISSPQWRATLAPPITCTDERHLGHSPALSWSGAPSGTATYAVTVVDPDAHDFVHWTLLDLPPSTRSLPEGASPGGSLPAGARELDNGFGKPGYGGPCPPSGSTHHYVLTVWAVRGHPSSIADVRHDALAAGTLTTTYSR